MLSPLKNKQRLSSNVYQLQNVCGQPKSCQRLYVRGRDVMSRAIRDVNRGERVDACCHILEDFGRIRGAEMFHACLSHSLSGRLRLCLHVSGLRGLRNVAIIGSDFPACKLSSTNGEYHS